MEFRFRWAQDGHRMDTNGMFCLLLLYSYSEFRYYKYTHYNHQCQPGQKTNIRYSFQQKSTFSVLCFYGNV